MVVNSRSAGLPRLDLGYLGLFLGLQVNRLVVERFRAAGLEAVRESHGYLIQHLIEKERSITELARRMEVSQQAASKVVAELAGRGILETVPGPDRRQRIIRLSDRGWEFVKFARKCRQRIEGRLIRAVGADEYEGARATLAKCLDALGGMPRVRSRRILQPQ